MENTFNVNVRYKSTNDIKKPTQINESAFYYSIEEYYKYLFFYYI